MHFIRSFARARTHTHNVRLWFSEFGTNCGIHNNVYCLLVVRYDEEIPVFHTQLEKTMLPPPLFVKLNLSLLFYFIFEIVSFAQWMKLKNILISVEDL